MANLLTLLRVLLLFVVIGVWARKTFVDLWWLDLLMVLLLAWVIFMDALDGWVARRRKEASELGALVDIAGDRIGVMATGSVSIRPNENQYAKLQQATCILNSMDFDGNPGAEANQWWAKQFQCNKRWPVPVGKDPGEYFERLVKKYQAEGLGLDEARRQAFEDIRLWVVAGLPPVLTLDLLHAQKPGRSGPSAKKQDTKGAGPDIFRQAAAESGPEEILSESVQQLRRLLKRHHQCEIVIESTRKWLRQKGTRRYYAGSGSDEISNLVMFNDEVVKFLDGFSEAVINAEHF